MQELVLYHSYTTVFCAHTFVHPHICTHTHAQRIHNGSFANILLDFVQPKVQCLCLQCSQKMRFTVRVIVASPHLHF